MDEKQFAALMDKLDKILRVQALNVVKSLPKEQDKIRELDAAGFKPADIDRLLAKTSGYSNVVLGRLKEKKQSKTTGSTPTVTTTATTQTTPTTSGQTARSQEEVVTA